MRVVCLSDQGRPEDIPISYWIKKGAEYTVISAYNDMNGILLFELLEIDLKPLGTLYRGFAASRFRPIDSFIDEFENELVKDLELVL